MEGNAFPPGLNLSHPGTLPPLPGPRAACAGAVLLLALVGNGIVLRRLCRGQAHRQRDLVVGHLALVDLAGCGLALLPRLVTELRGTTVPPSAVVCRLLPLLQRCGPLLSAYGLVLLALERYRPRLPARSLAALGWFLAPLLAVPQAFAFRSAPRPGGLRCWSVFEELPFWHGLTFTIYGAVTGFVLPAGLLCWACARSLAALGAARRQRRRSVEGGRRRGALPGPEGGRGLPRSRSRALRLPLVLAVLFALCRLPHCALELGLAAAAAGDGRRDTLEALAIVAAANNALNPYICLLLHSHWPRQRRVRRDVASTGTWRAIAAVCCCLCLDGQGRRGAALRRPLRLRAGTPSIPSSLGTPGASGSPDIPGTPGISGSPGTPSIPGTAGSSGTPSTPSIASTPSTFGTPSSSGSAGTPSSPGAAGSPGTSGSFGFPGVRGGPVPGAPTLAAAPGPVRPKARY
ncbi:putative G-protein coupled receptor 150 [Balearica regulorum gibbericeps]|uniref:putative G-protein coupled receptor 150 n=1 Tax=Balearica regulorum gibbericeps TaxID=100784 RepID=UPI003F5E26F6